MVAFLANLADPRDSTLNAFGFPDHHPGMPVNSELLTSLLNPITAENPSGRDLRYEPEYAAFKEERREDLLIPGSDDSNRKVADWNRVVAMGSELLTKQTKDLQLAAWMTEAMLRQQGISGLITGLNLLQGLLEQYWDTLYPEIEDDDLELRSGPLQWVGSKLTVAVQQTTVASGGITWLSYSESRSIPLENAIAEASYDDQRALRAAREEASGFGKTMPEEVDAAVEKTGKVFFKALVKDLDTALSALDSLEKTSDSRFGDDAPAYTDLRKSLDEFRRLAGGILSRKLEADPDPVDEANDDAVDGSIASPDSAALSPEPVGVQDASERIAVAARWFRQRDSTNPAPYAMLRGFRWGELRSSAPDINPRLLEAPTTAARSRLKGLMLDGRWSDLLEQCEVLMASPSGRGWLDLQRYALSACSNLGSGYDAVASVIRSELKSLLLSAPGLPRTTLMDDTPTANDETREWLETIATNEASADDGSDAEGTSDGSDSQLPDGADALSEAIEDDQSTSQQGGFARAVRRPRVPRAVDPFDLARNELTAGRPNRAVELLTAELARDSSPRGRFVRQTQIAWIMVEAGLYSVAQPLLKKIIATIDDRSLEDWESGALVAQPMSLLYRVLQQTGDNDDERSELYLRICRLDPVQALTLSAP